MFLAEAAHAAARESNIYQSVMFIGVAILFFYLILFRPEQKRRKKMDALRKGLKKGDRVVAMGICATIDEVREKSAILKQYDGSKIEMLLAAISDVQLEPSDADQKAPLKA